MKSICWMSCRSFEAKPVTRRLSLLLFCQRTYLSGFSQFCGGSQGRGNRQLRPCIFVQTEAQQDGGRNDCRREIVWRRDAEIIEGPSVKQGKDDARNSSVGLLHAHVEA